MTLTGIFLYLGGYLAFVVVCEPFIQALKAEAPALYAGLGSPSVSRYLWRRQLFMPFSSLILSRAYRQALADCPIAKMWGSWVFVAHWVQIAGLFLVLVGVLLRMWS